MSTCDGMKIDIWMLELGYYCRSRKAFSAGTQYLKVNQSINLSARTERAVKRITGLLVDHRTGSERRSNIIIYFHPLDNESGIQILAGSSLLYSDIYSELIEALGSPSLQGERMCYSGEPETTVNRTEEAPPSACCVIEVMVGT